MEVIVIAATWLLGLVQQLDLGTQVTEPGRRVRDDVLGRKPYPPLAPVNPILSLRLLNEDLDYPAAAARWPAPERVVRGVENGTALQTYEIAACRSVDIPIRKELKQLPGVVTETPDIEI